MHRPQLGNVSKDAGGWDATGLAPGYPMQAAAQHDVHIRKSFPVSPVQDYKEKKCVCKVT